MKRSFLHLTALMLVLALAACSGGDRATRDARIARACEAAVKTLYKPEDTLTVKKTGFRSEKSHDKLDIRVVTLNAHYVENGGVILEKEYTCGFEETKGLFGYGIKFYYMEKDGQRYGNFAGTIEGDYSDLLKINTAVQDVR